MGCMWLHVCDYVMWGCAARPPSRAAPCGLWRSKLPCCELSHGEARTARKVVSGWPPARNRTHQSNNPPGTECCQQPRELGGASFSCEASDETHGHSRHLDCRLVRAWAQEPVSCEDPWPTKTGKINVCCLSHQIWWYGYTAIDNNTRREKISNWEVLKGGSSEK